MPRSKKSKSGCDKRAERSLKLILPLVGPCEDHYSWLFARAYNQNLRAGMTPEDGDEATDVSAAMLWDGSVSATLQKTGNEQAELVVKTGNEQAEEHAKQGKKEARVPFQIYVTPPQTPPSTPTQTPPSTPGASSSTAHGADSASHAERGTNDASAGPQAQRQLVLTADVPPTPSMRKRMGGGS